MSRSIYLVLPGWEGELDDAHESVVEALSHGPTYINVALELWRLVDNEERATKIEQVLEHAYDRENRDINTAEIAELDALLNGIDEAVKISWLDDKWMIRPEHLSEVRRRTRLLQVGEHRGRLAGDGIMEGLSQVHELRKFLQQALKRGLHVALD